jgi:asparagine synthetase B (glutamine-hydrolysing)
MFNIHLSQKNPLFSHRAACQSILTRKQVTVALSEDGGDEQFAGYVRYWSTKVMAGGFHRFPISFKKP